MYVLMTEIAYTI